MQRFAQYMVLMLGLLFITAGCNKTDPEADLVPCAGTVLLDGQPLADAEVRMKNSRGNSFGKTDKDGKFRMRSSFKSIARDGAQSGTMLVAVIKRVPREPSEMKPGLAGYKNLLHQRYEHGETSGIEFVLPIDGIEDALIEISSETDALLAPVPSSKTNP